jgi:hypothetical protein
VEAGDVIEAENYDDRIERHLLDTISYQWGAAEMTCAVRSPKDVFNPAAVQQRRGFIALSDEVDFNPWRPDDPDAGDSGGGDEGGGSTPVPGSKSYTATSGKAFGNAGTHSTSQMYQGYYSSTWGNNKSCVFFPTTIAADLAGKTITGCSVTFKTQFAYYNAGLTAVIGTHNSLSSITAYPSSGVKSNRVQKKPCVAGSTYTVSLGTTVGNEFQAGTAKGITFGPGPSNSLNYYGYHYLSGMKLSFTYTTP